MLPHFVWEDFGYVIEDLRRRGFEMEKNWFSPHFEFRFPFVGDWVKNLQVAEPYGLSTLV
jgi:uncharacterized protein (DUF2126 family)